MSNERPGPNGKYPAELKFDRNINITPDHLFAEAIPKRSKQVLYVSGPMRGQDDYHYPEFNALAQYLRTQDYGDVKNPADNYPGEAPGTHTYAEYMRLDIASVLASTGIVLMPGWQKSEGAKFEATIARLLGLTFYEAKLKSAAPDHDSVPDPASPLCWRIQMIDTPKDIVDSDGIEAQARALVYGDRNESYGPPSHDFECTGRKWAATLSAHTGTTIPDIPPVIVAIMMADLKSSRMANNPEHLDSRIDLIGYTLCADRIITGK